MVNKNKEIFDAILSIDPTAKVIITGNTLDTVVIDWLEETTPILKADIESKMAELLITYQEKLDKKATDKANANSKLKALGLTDDEIKAIKS